MKPETGAPGRARERASLPSGLGVDAPDAELTRPSRIHRGLARVLAANFRGRTALIGAPLPGLLDAARARGTELHELEPSSLTGCTDPGAAPTETFDTLLLHGVLESISAEAAPELLETAWQRVQPEGRLVVCVPNEGETGATRASPRFNRRGLKRLLRPLGPVKLVSEQPFAWLVMIVDASPRPSSGTLERCWVIADRCRGRVLELGCGPGFLTRAIADRGLPVVGVDKSADKIRLARARCPGIAFLQADILALTDEETVYDTVVLAEVLEHVPEEVSRKMLEIAWSLLSPGGRLIVSVPNEDCVPHRNHLQRFSRRSLAQLLESFGRPRLVTEQPFKYLLMTVERPAR